MKRFHDICISRKSEWDNLSARSEALHDLEREVKVLRDLEREVKVLREKLKAYETGCINKGTHCAACKNGRATESSFLERITYDCVLEIPCSKFEDKGEREES